MFLYIKHLPFLFIFSVFLFSCSNTSLPDSQSENTDPIQNSDSTTEKFDKDDIRFLNNAIDTLVRKFDKVLERNYNSSSDKGIIGTFTYSVQYGKGYSSGSYSYSYTYTFTDKGSYTLSYSQSSGTDNGSNGYSLSNDSGNFILYKKDGFFYITLNSSKGDITNYRYLVSNKTLVLLNDSDKTNYKLDLDELNYKFNSSDDELNHIEHYSRNSGYDGIIGKWTCYLGEMWSNSGKDYMGKYYENKYWPKILEIEFCEDGLFTLTKKITSKVDNKSVTNFVQGVFGVIETDENDFQLGLVSMNEKQLLSHYKVSDHFLHFDKSLEEIFSIFEVKYSSDFGTVPLTISVQENMKLTAEQLPELECNGYKFLGWYIGDERIKADSFLVNSNITLQAKWSQIGYSVTFETNNGTTLPSKILSYLYRYEMPEISKDNYTFDGWYLNSSLTSPVNYPYKVYQPITVYAKWLFNYKVSFQTNSSSVLPDYRTSKITSLPELEQNGYIFGGWYLDSIFSQKANVPLSLNSDITLYAKWKNTSEAIIITSETIDTVDLSYFNCPFTVYYKGEITSNYLYSLCNKISSFNNVSLNFSKTNGITAIDFYQSKNFYVIRHTNFTATIKPAMYGNFSIEDITSIK